MARIGTWEQNLTNGGCCRGATGPGLGSATVDLDQAAGWRKFSKVLSKHTLVGVRFRTVVCVSQLYHHFVKQRIVLKWYKKCLKSVLPVVFQSSDWSQQRRRCSLTVLTLRLRSRSEESKKCFVVSDHRFAKTTFRWRHGSAAAAANASFKCFDER